MKTEKVVDKNLLLPFEACFVDFDIITTDPAEKINKQINISVYKWELFQATEKKNTFEPFKLISIFKISYFPELNLLKSAWLYWSALLCRLFPITTNSNSGCKSRQRSVCFYLNLNPNIYHFLPHTCEANTYLNF